MRMTELDPVAALVRSEESRVDLLSVSETICTTTVFVTDSHDLSSCASHWEFPLKATPSEKPLIPTREN